MEKQIKGYEAYLISDTGVVRSLKKGSVIKPVKTNSGYLRVMLYNQFGRRWRSIHRLVAENFMGNPSSLPQVHHKDEDKTNNRISNLEWVSAKRNTNEGTRNKRISEAKKRPIELWNGNGVSIIFPCVDEAKKAGFGHADAVARGERKSTKGFYAEYI